MTSVPLRLLDSAGYPSLSALDRVIIFTAGASSS